MTDQQSPLSTDSPLSDDLQRIAREAAAHGSLTLQGILDLFGREGFLLLQVFLAVMNIVLSPLPGQSTVLGAVMTLVAWAMLRDHDRVILPQRFGQYKIEASYVASGFDKLHRLYKRCTPTLLRQRPSGLSYRHVTWAIMIMSLVILAPIPFGNTVAAIAIILLGIGQAERDGAWIWAGMAVTVLHIVLPIWGIHYLIVHFA